MRAYRAGVGVNGLICLGAVVVFFVRGLTKRRY